MIEITQKEMQKSLKKFKNKGIYIKITGVIAQINTIYKLDYYFNKGVVYLKDKISKNCIDIEMSQIYRILINEQRTILKLFMDDDIVITIID